MLETTRLFLRDLCQNDFDSVHSYATDPEVVRYMEWGPNSIDQTREFLDRARHQTAEDPRTMFELAVIESSSGDLIGAVGLHGDDAQAMLGYCFSRAAWGHGYATEAARRVMAFGFDEMGFRRIWSGCDTQNMASLRVLEKLGMRREETLRRDCQIRGQWRDTAVFGILCGEWKQGLG